MAVKEHGVYVVEYDKSSRKPRLAYKTQKDAACVGMKNAAQLKCIAVRTCLIENQSCDSNYIVRIDCSMEMVRTACVPFTIFC